jgi:hypothetical protein
MMLRWVAIFIIALLPVLTREACSAEPGELASKVYLDFCIPAVSGGDPAKIAESIGAGPGPDDLRPYAGFIIRQGLHGKYFGFRLEKGWVAFRSSVVNATAICAVYIFDVEANAFGEAASALLQGKGYKITEKPHPSGMRELLFSSDTGIEVTLAWSTVFDHNWSRVQLISYVKRRL